jgi:hypothetical protein
MSAFATGQWQAYAFEAEAADEQRALRAAVRSMGWVAWFSPLPPAKVPIAAAPAEAPGAPAPRAVEPRPAAGPRPADAAAVPDRQLRFAEYLFYRGLVGWEDVVAALRWQRGQRPVVGQIAVQWGWLDHDDVRELLERRCRERAFSVPFLEFAQRAGFLTEAQRTALLGQQRRLQRRIGEYFVESGLLSGAEVDGVAEELRRHNARCRVREGKRAAAPDAPHRPPKR